MKYILALDQGTTSSRAIVFDRKGQVVSVAQREFQQIFPQPGWVEHDAREIWATQHAVTLQALDALEKTSGASRATDIAGIGITNQRETTVLWDRETGHPVANAIVWQDRRTAARCDQLRAQGHAARFQNGAVVTGLAQLVGGGETGDAAAEDDHPGGAAPGEREVGLLGCAKGGGDGLGAGDEAERPHGGEESAGPTADAHGAQKPAPRDGVVGHRPIVYQRADQDEQVLSMVCSAVFSLDCRLRA